MYQVVYMVPDSGAVAPRRVGHAQPSTVKVTTLLILINCVSKALCLWAGTSQLFLLEVFLSFKYLSEKCPLFQRDVSSEGLIFHNVLYYTPVL